MQFWGLFIGMCKQMGEGAGCVSYNFKILKPKLLRKNFDLAIASSFLHNLFFLIRGKLSLE